MSWVAREIAALKLRWPYVMAVKDGDNWGTSRIPWQVYGQLVSWLNAEVGHDYEMSLSPSGHPVVGLRDPDAAFAFKLRWA